MAGEWVPIDCNLATKPEVLKLSALTAQPPDVVVGRLALLWCWVQLNAVDGEVECSPEVLAIVAGGDSSFWQAVEKVGWLTFTDSGKMLVSGWDKRFTQAAKERLKGQRRQQDKRKRDKTVTEPLQHRDKSVTPRELKERRDF